MTLAPNTARPTTRRRLWPHRLVALALVLGGGVLMGEPLAETYVNNAEGAQVTYTYAQSVAAAPPAALDAHLARAQAYNAALPASALFDPWGPGGPNNDPGHARYLAQLGQFDAMARIRIPQISVDLPIFHDATKLSLAQGAGHMYGTSLPVGGPDTHAVIAGHTGMRSRTMFDRLPDLRVDQTFYIDVYGETLTYRIDRISVVPPSELEAVARIPGGDYVTLVTCYRPAGEEKQRMLVRGVRVVEPPAAAPAPQSGTIVVPVSVDASVQEWMPPRIAGVAGSLALALVFLVTWLAGDRRRAAAQQRVDASPSREEAVR